MNQGNLSDQNIFAPLFSKIDELIQQNSPVIVAIEGGSAAGKTTLAETIRLRYGCAVFHMDDFFLRPEQRTAERLAEAGGNVDRERFLEEILLPLTENGTVCYRPYDCSTQRLRPPVTVTPKGLCIVEGAYSMHPDLAPYYDCSFFLDISPELQRERILQRNPPPVATRFFEEWIPLENEYFTQTRAKGRCSATISIQGI